MHLMQYAIYTKNLIDLLSVFPKRLYVTSLAGQKCQNGFI